jgi:carboxyl-terminal processing protease
VRALKDDLNGARGLVLDLRDNSGGEAEAMTDVASLFLPPGRILGRFNDRMGHPRIEPQTRTSLRSTADTPVRFEGPVVVLTSARTASAAEVFAAALKESGRAAAVIGETTCGCVLAIRRRHALPDGGTLDVSELDYRTSKGTRLEGTGLEPDARAAPTRRSLRDGKDTVMEHAIGILKAANKNRLNRRR